jgi:hypothetical protein
VLNCTAAIVTYYLFYLLLCSENLKNELKPLEKGFVYLYASAAVLLPLY